MDDNNKFTLKPNFNGAEVRADVEVTEYNVVVSIPSNDLVLMFSDDDIFMIAEAIKDARKHAGELIGIRPLPPDDNYELCIAMCKVAREEAGATREQYKHCIRQCKRIRDEQNAN